jgi:hypothetical protein
MPYVHKKGRPMLIDIVIVVLESRNNTKLKFE